jgi:hypothetical protein
MVKKRINPREAKGLAAIVGVCQKYTWVDTFRTALLSPTDEIRTVLGLINTISSAA